jgi:hypothetical protein
MSQRRPIKRCSGSSNRSSLGECSAMNPQRVIKCPDRPREGERPSESGLSIRIQCHDRFPRQGDTAPLSTPRQPAIRTGRTHPDRGTNGTGSEREGGARARALHPQALGTESARPPGRYERVPRRRLNSGCCRCVWARANPRDFCHESRTERSGFTGTTFLERLILPRRCVLPWSYGLPELRSVILGSSDSGFCEWTRPSIRFRVVKSGPGLQLFGASPPRSLPSYLASQVRAPLLEPGFLKPLEGNRPTLRSISDAWFMGSVKSP